VGLFRIFLLSVFAILFSACSAETAQRSAKKSQTVEQAPVAPEVEASSGDATSKEVVEEVVEEVELPESIKSDKSIYAFEIRETGGCMFSFEGKTKAEGCNLLIDKEADSCLIEYRRDIYSVSCVEGGVSFEEGLSTVL
jgi:hypothetical protein